MRWTVKTRLMRWTVKTRLMRWTVKSRYIQWTARTSTKPANAIKLGMWWTARTCIWARRQIQMWNSLIKHSYYIFLEFILYIYLIYYRVYLYPIITIFELN